MVAAATCALPKVNSVHRQRNCCLSLVIPLALWVSLSGTVKAETAGKRPPPKLNLITEVEVTTNTDPKWCYDETPEYIYFRGRSLVRARLNGEDISAIEIDRAPAVRSLLCSTTGRTIFFLSALFDRAYVLEGGQIAEYAIAFPGPTSIRFGALMSPDGATFVLPSNPTHVKGPDLLKEKRLIFSSNTDAFWTRKFLFHALKGNQYAVVTPSDRQQISTMSFPSNISAGGVFECAENRYVLVYTDNRERTYARWLDIATARLREPVVKSNYISWIDSDNTSCLFVVSKDNELGVSVADRLILAGGRSATSIDIAAFEFVNKFFYRSKDRSYLLSFQRDPLESRGGRIVVLHSSQPLRN